MHAYKILFSLITTLSKNKKIIPEKPKIIPKDLKKLFFHL